MAVSTIPAIQQAILNVLTADASLAASVTIRAAALTETEDMPENGEIVYLGDVDIPEENWGSLGGYQRNEDYWVGIVIWCEQWGDDPMAARVRGHAIWSDVADALRADLVAPGGLLRAAGAYQFDGFRGRDSTAPIAPQKWACRIDRSINFKAKI
jgi:hypothetical protein